MSSIKQILLKKRKVYFFIIYIVFLATISGCVAKKTSTGSYQSAQVYTQPLYSRIIEKSMEYEGVARNPLIVIHGFFGAKLKETKNDKFIWGDFDSSSAMQWYSNQYPQKISFPMKYGEKLNKIKSNAYPVSILDIMEVNLLGFKFRFNAYNNCLNIMEKNGYVIEGKPLPKNKNFYSLFVFAYDWRMDLVENAKKLHKFILSKKAYLQKKYEELYGIKNYDVQFDLLAHSMGGLLARYYLRYGNQELDDKGTFPVFDWRGSKNVDKVLIVGTPNAGYLNAFMELVNGLQIGPGIKLFPAAVTGTFPSYYQMLPLLSTRSVLYKDDLGGLPVDIFDPEVWIKYKLGLANPNQDEILKLLLPNVKTKEERYKIAIDHLKKCLTRARAFMKLLYVHKQPPSDVAFYLFFGDAVKTARTAVLDKNTGKVEIIDYDAGDGIVLTSSALMDEREGRKWQPIFLSPIVWHSVFPLMAAHMGITECYPFADNATYCLLVSPTDQQQKRVKYYRPFIEKIIYGQSKEK